MTPNEAANLVEAAAAAASAAGHINTSTMVIGVTGSGKSTLLATAAEHLWETYRAISAYYFADLGGYPDRMNALIRSGIVRIFRMRTRGMDLSFETALRSSQGWWPAKVLNPLTGEVAPGVPMVSPLQTQYTQTCQCGKARVVLAKAQLGAGSCQCGRRWSPASSTVTTSTRLTPGLDAIRLRMYDGLTSMSEWYLQDLSHRLDLAGEMGALGGTVHSGEVSFRSNNRAQVGFAQARAHELVSNALAIPNQIIMPIFTALSDEAADSTKRLTVVGPKLAGSAKTEIAGAWFGSTLEAATVPGETPGTKIRTLFLSEFVDEDGRRHVLKHRSSPLYMPEKLQDPPYSEAEKPQAMCSQFSLGVFFSLLADADAKALEEAQRRFPDAPGLAAVPLELEVAGGETPADAKPETAAAVGAGTANTPAGAPKPGGLARPKGAQPRKAAAAAVAQAPQVAPVAPTAPVTEPTVPAAEVPPQTIVEAVLATEPTTAPVVETPTPAAPPAPPVAAAAAVTPSGPPAPPAPSAPPAPAANGWAPPPGTRPVARALPTPRRPVAPPA